MSTNPHYENAVAWLDDDEGESKISPYWMQRAQIEATLALVWEQVGGVPTSCAPPTC